MYGYLAWGVEGSNSKSGFKVLVYYYVAFVLSLLEVAAIVRGQSHSPFGLWYGLGFRVLPYIVSCRSQRFSACDTQQMLGGAPRFSSQSP